jgi:hypothetical protein
MQEKYLLRKELESGKMNLPSENVFLYNRRDNISKGTDFTEFQK